MSDVFEPCHRLGSASRSTSHCCTTDHLLPVDRPTLSADIGQISAERWAGFGIDHWLAQLGSSEARKMYEELWSMVRDGSLELPVSSSHPLDEFADALMADAAHGRIGKVILKTA